MAGAGAAAGPRRAQRGEIYLLTEEAPGGDGTPGTGCEVLPWQRENGSNWILVKPNRGLMRGNTHSARLRPGTDPEPNVDYTPFTPLQPDEEAALHLATAEFLNPDGADADGDVGFAGGA